MFACHILSFMLLLLVIYGLFHLSCNFFVSSGKLSIGLSCCYISFHHFMWSHDLSDYVMPSDIHCVIFHIVTLYLQLLLLLTFYHLQCFSESISFPCFLSRFMCSARHNIIASILLKPIFRVTLYLVQINVFLHFL